MDFECAPAALYLVDDEDRGLINGTSEATSVTDKVLEVEPPIELCDAEVVVVVVVVVVVIPAD